MFASKKNDDLEQAVKRLSEEKLYAEVLREIENGTRRDGIWGKALLEGEFDERKAKTIYMKLRIQALKDEMLLDLTRRRETQLQQEEIRRMHCPYCGKDVKSKDALCPSCRELHPWRV